MCFWYKVPKFEHSLVIFSLANWSNTKIPAFLPASLRAVQIPEFLCRVQKADILPVSKIPALSRAWHPAISPSRVYIAFNWALNLSPWISERKMHISMQLGIPRSCHAVQRLGKGRSRACANSHHPPPSHSPPFTKTYFGHISLFIEKAGFSADWLLCV